jgi:hypothetical protein
VGVDAVISGTIKRSKPMSSGSAIAICCGNMTTRHKEVLTVTKRFGGVLNEEHIEKVPLSKRKITLSV